MFEAQRKIKQSMASPVAKRIFWVFKHILNKAKTFFKNILLDNLQNNIKQ